MLLSIKSDEENKKKIDIVKEKDYENVNLLYVAMTRAKYLLLVNEEVLYHANNINQYLNNCALASENYLNPNFIQHSQMINFNNTVKPISTSEYLEVLTKMKLNLHKK